MSAADPALQIGTALTAILERHQRADKTLQRLFAGPPALDEAQRAPIATAVYDIIRYARWLAAVAGLIPPASSWPARKEHAPVEGEDLLGHGPEAGISLADHAITSLHSAEDSIDIPAAPTEPVAAIPSSPEPGASAIAAGLYDAWQLWRGHRPPRSAADQELLARVRELAATRALRESLPDWLDARGLVECGAEWEPLIAALNRPALQVLRANTLKCSPAQLAAAAARHGAGTRHVSWAPEALVLDRYSPLFEWEEFRQGWFEMQDAASQAVVPLLEVKPGMRVIDACAGNGGKSLHLAALMKNRGRIIALDVDATSLAELERRARRAGCTIIETRLIRSTKVIKRLAGSADRLLLDLPCSGTGVWRRNPDARWRLQPGDLTRLLERQAQILGYYSRMVKPGGRLVYATCSVFPSEGEAQVARFLAAAGTGFSLAAEQRLDPGRDGFDGFYIAALQRQPAASRK